MSKKKDDDVTLPEEPKTPEETAPAPESVDGGTPPPAEDVQELPEEKPSELGAPPEPIEEKASVVDREIHEKLKIFQNRDATSLEEAYNAWSLGKQFDVTGGEIRQRLLADGGNGLLHLAIFYVD